MPVQKLTVYAQPFTPVKLFFLSASKESPWKARLWANTAREVQAQQLLKQKDMAGCETAYQASRPRPGDTHKSQTELSWSI